MRSVRALSLTAAVLVVACSGAAVVPTPINSPSVPLPSLDLRAFCQGSATEARDLEAVAAAAAAAASSNTRFSMPDAEARIDSAIRGLRGLALTGEAAAARDTAIAELERLRRGDADANAARAASAALTAFNAAKSTFCR
jgi:hypothetical protein